MRQHGSLWMLFTVVSLTAFVSDTWKSTSEEGSPIRIAQATASTEQALTGEVQERDHRIQSETFTPAQILPAPVPLEQVPLPTMSFTSNPPAFGALPGEFAIRTNGNKVAYLTARDGGHHSIDAIITTASAVGRNEQFKLTTVQPHFTTIQTASGYFVSAVGELGGPPNVTQGIQTELLTPQNDIALFSFVKGGEDPRYLRVYGDYHIQTFDGHFLTALGGGGRATDAFHTDAREAKSWEEFSLVKCGDLGSGYDYAIHGSLGTDTRSLAFDKIFVAQDGGGRVKDALPFHNMTRFTPDTTRDFDWARLKLIRQNDGSYALQTSDGKHFVTAIRGGGIAHSPSDWDNLVTDRTQVQAWETFRIVDRGDCTHTIQTVNGWYLAGQTTGPFDVSTRISDPNSASAIGYSPWFEFVMWGRP